MRSESMNATRTWATIHGEAAATLSSKDGKTGILRLSLPGTATPEAKYHVTDAGAIAEFGAMAEQESGDFDGEANFGDWVLFVFTEARGVRMMF